MMNWNDISKKEFEVPPGYFDQFPGVVKRRVQEEVFETQRILILEKTLGNKPKSKKTIWYAFTASAAAALVLLGWFFLKINHPNSPVQIVEFDAVLDSTALNEEEIIILLNDEDLAYLYEEQIAELPAFEVNQLEIKPNREKSSLSLDSLSSEEILDYLIESDIDILEIQ